jgi:hypothetical protein
VTAAATCNSLPNTRQLLEPEGASLFAVIFVFCSRAHGKSNTHSKATMIQTAVPEFVSPPATLTH